MLYCSKEWKKTWGNKKINKMAKLVTGENVWDWLSEPIWACWPLAGWKYEVCGEMVGLCQESIVMGSSKQTSTQTVKALKKDAVTSSDVQPWVCISHPARGGTSLLEVTHIYQLYVTVFFFGRGGGGVKIKQLPVPGTELVRNTTKSSLNSPEKNTHILISSALTLHCTLIP